MTPTETPLPVSGLPSAPVRVWVASRPRVALLEVSAKNSDRLGAGLDVLHAGLAAQRLDLGLGAAGADHADLAEGHLLRHAGRGDGLGGVGQRRAVDQDGGLAGERGQLLAQVRRDGGQLGSGARRGRRRQAERDDGGRTGGQGREDACDALGVLLARAAPSGRRCNPNDRSSPGYVAGLRCRERARSSCDHRVGVVGGVDGRSGDEDVGPGLGAALDRLRARRRRRPGATPRGRPREISSRARRILGRQRSRNFWPPNPGSTVISSSMSSSPSMSAYGSTGVAGLSAIDGPGALGAQLAGQPHRARPPPRRGR